MDHWSPRRARAEAAPAVLQRADGSWLIDGDTHIDVVKDLLKLSAVPNESDFYTLAGFMLSHFDRVPAVGDHFSWEGRHFEVVDMDGLRIDKVLITPMGAAITVSPDTPGA
jgi:putative hemolysin